MIFSNFIELCNHQHNPILEHLYHLKNESLILTVTQVYIFKDRKEILHSQPVIKQDGFHSTRIWDKNLINFAKRICVNIFMMFIYYNLPATAFK